MRLVEGVAAVEDVDAFLAALERAAGDCTVQAFDARYVVGREHLRRALARADRAIERGENVARERAVETLLYAAGRRQIDCALEMGVDEGEHPVVVLVAAPPGGPSGVLGAGDADPRDAPGDPERAAAGRVRDLLAPAETLGEYDPERVAEFFEVTPAERAAADGDLADLVLERVALLDVEK